MRSQGMASAVHRGFPKEATCLVIIKSHYDFEIALVKLHVQASATPWRYDPAQLKCNLKEDI